jgi:GntR family transcriptional regulator/MocR family aminotransferase
LERRQGRRTGRTRGGGMLTPAHFFPHGVPLHPVRRTAVIDWPAPRALSPRGRLRRGVPLRPPTRRRRTGLDPQRVAYLGSASKSLTPCCGSIRRFRRPRRARDRRAGGQQFYVNSIDQLTMADFIRCG